MTKILPINNIKIKNTQPVEQLLRVTKPPMKAKMSINPAGKIFTLAITGLAFPSVAKYQESFNENYFKLAINPDNNEPYRADIFQKAAAMNLYEGKDVLVTAPTGTGKTAIAKYIITKNLKEGKKTFYTTPLKALSNEKYLDFCKTYGENNVGLLTGDVKTNPNAKIIVMTTEIYRNMAASNLFNFQNDKGNIGIPKDLKTVIFDELQYLGDVDRGGIWEQAIMFTPENVQLLSLSATVGNNKEINEWLALIKGNAAINVTPSEGYIPDNNLKKESILINVPPENRHVPLNFEVTHAAAEIKVPRNGTKSQIIHARQEAARKSQTIMATVDKIAYKYLTGQLNSENKLPAIYFIFNKKECRHLLKYLSEESELLTTEREREQISEIIKRYLDKGEYLGENLNTNALMKGYAIHNAGLLPTQKTLIEELFQKKLVKVVLATETLSAGINMPARTTVISAPRKPSSTSDGMDDHKRNLTSNEFHQMAGRAGRRGIDAVGYCCALSCNPIQKDFFTNIINSAPNKLDSNIDFDYSFIASYLAEFDNEDEFKRILSKSLYAYEPETKEINEDKLQKLMNLYHIKRSILQKEKFITDEGKLTTKGELLKILNGYEQIPVINVLTNKKLATLSPVQLASVIGLLANIHIEGKEDFSKRSTETKYTQYYEVNDLINKLNINDEILKYSTESCELHKNMEIKPDYKPMEHLYSWAKTNEKEENSKKNWKEMVKGEGYTSIKDEGSLFKEITMTIDLIKQLIKTTRLAENKELNKEDSYYFNVISNNLEKALNLIQRQPIQ